MTITTPIRHIWKAPPEGKLDIPKPLLSSQRFQITIGAPFKQHGTCESYEMDAITGPMLTLNNVLLTGSTVMEKVVSHHDRMVVIGCPVVIVSLHEE